MGLDEPTRDTSVPHEDPTLLPIDDDLAMGGMDIEDSNAIALARAEEGRRERETLSPLTELGADDALELERTFQLQQPDDEEDETTAQAHQRVKRRRVLEADANTELGGSQIRAQQEDRSNILKAPTFLPRDPMLLALMNMQRSGGFVSNILGDGRSMGWAPELRGILSLEVVRRAGDLKRKRDSAAPVLEIPQEEE